MRKISRPGHSNSEIRRMRYLNVNELRSMVHGPTESFFSQYCTSKMGRLKPLLLFLPILFALDDSCVDYGLEVG